MRTSPRASYAIITTEVVAFAATLSIVDFPFGEYGFSYSGLQSGMYWTILTSLFIHVNISHLAINMFLLYVFATALEKRKGPGLMAVAFFVGGAVPLLLGAPFYSAETIIVGSSIAVSAVIGAVLVSIPNTPSPIFLLRAPLGLVGMIYLIFNVFFALTGQTAYGIAYPSHVIGFLVGGAVALPLRRRPWPGASL